MKKNINELTVEDLILNIDLPETHEIIEDSKSWGIIGQPRALKALKMGIEIKAKGYNLFITGEPGTGRKTATMQILKDHCRKVAPLKDIAYVYNFKKPENPQILFFPEGTASKFKKEMKKLVIKVKEIIIKNLSEDSYKSGRDRMITEIEKQENRKLSEFEDKLVKNGFRTIQSTEDDEDEPVTDLIPLYKKEAVTFEELQTFVTAGTITEDDWQQTREKYYHFMDEMKNLFLSIKKEREKMEDEINKGAENAVRKSIKKELNRIKKIWIQEEIKNYLSDVEKDVIQYHSILIDESMTEDMENILSERYDINIIVEHGEESELPIITENHPTDVNLFGNIETNLDLSGESSTSFMMIRAGSIIQASGGFLILQAEDILKNEETWNSLKRILETGEAEIRGQQSPLGIPVTNLKPEAVAINTKVIIIGSSDMYFTLSQLDSDFVKHFKISVEFDSDMIRNSSTTAEYVVFIKNLIKKEKLKDINDEGILEVCKYGIKLSLRRDRLSTQFSLISDLLRESDYWTSMGNKKIIDKESVLRAIKEKIYILNLPEEKLDDQINRGIILIEREGSVIGSINGLVVIDRGYYSFGLPVRITSTAGPGKKGLINIEKESGLSGHIHDKGMFILEGFLRKRYGSDFPISFTSSICMEQSYSGVDGDSASAAELFSLISELGSIPLRQDIAVTGSINQFGEIQPVGGVSEKIEGFFTVCSKKKLSGKQGVLIPKINKNNLLISDKILNAIKKCQFHIYTMENVDEGLLLMTGMEPGEKAPDGIYPKGSINRIIAENLKKISSISLDKD
ncbi:MAG: ATP-binding protein [Spirochaetaceae bacterium]|nr:ATP-binding protein [Spirochaetaceae bacterium]